MKSDQKKGSLDTSRPSTVMEARQEKKPDLEGSGPVITGKDQIALISEPEASTNTPPTSLHVPKPVITAYEATESPHYKENLPPDTNTNSPGPNMSPQAQSPQAQTQRKEEAKPTIHPAEKVRRGLSFGPIKKPGESQSSTRDNLKGTSKSPPSQSNHRSLSQSSDNLETRDVRRLGEDNYADNGDEEEEAAEESSEEETQVESSDEEISLAGQTRGRKRDASEESDNTPATQGKQLAFTVTTPEGEKTISTSKRFNIVRPNTNFDQSVSKTPSPRRSPNTTDSEEMDNIRRAQKLSVKMSGINQSVPHRVIQTIIRGNFQEMEKESEEGTRRLRKYLVATDQSEEAKYALEWTIGTVLRDGDTLYAVYAVNEADSTIKITDNFLLGEGGKAMQDTTAVMEKLTTSSKMGSLMSLPSPLLKGTFRPNSRSSSAARSTSSRSHSKAQDDRNRALRILRETCLQYLRKTALQVRIAIEIIHCKSPKHLITEAIDHLQPTLVIVGSRGRSGMKGVLLGSFSNYLVQKSSAPVMVARKRLKTKEKPTKVPLANNLTPSRKLQDAKID